MPEYHANPRLVYAWEGEVEDLHKKLAVARDALRIIAGERQCLDNLMSNGDVARAALELIGR